MKLPKILKPRNGAAILHFGRAGSTLLLSMITQNKLYFYEGELFEKVKMGELTLNGKLKNNPGLLFSNRADKYFYRRYLVSVKPIPELHLSKELLNMDYSSLIKYLQIAGINKYIIIKRKNYLRQTISRLLAVKRKKYHYTLNEDPKLEKVIVPCRNYKFDTFSGELLSFFKKYDQYYQKMEQLTPNPLIINYEDDIENNPMVAYKKAANYLNLKKRRPKIVFKKSNVFSNEDIIENYNEVEEYLHNTEYSWML